MAEGRRTNKVALYGKKFALVFTIKDIELLLNSIDNTLNGCYDANRKKIKYE